MASSRAHKMAKGQFASGGAVGRAMRTMRRHYADGGDVVKERAMFLPLGTYGDGTTRAAWPGLLHDSGTAIKRLVDHFYEGNYRPGDRDATRRLAEDSFTAASVAPVGGLVAGAVRGRMPRATLSSNAADDAAKRLPMDEASRMARAREMGFDTERTLYHGTNAKFDEFRPSDRGALGPGVYFSKIPSVAGRYGEPGEYLVRGNVLNTGPFKDIPDGLVDVVKAQLTPEEAKRWERMWPGTHDVYGNPKLPPDAETFREVLTRSVEPARVPEIMRRAGYDGMEGIADGHEVTMFDPRNIRSVNATFDPSQADSANLLASNPSTASVLSLLQDRKDRR